MAQKQQGIQAFLTDGSRLKMREPTHVLCLSWSNIIVVISKKDTYSENTLLFKGIQVY